MRESEHLSPRMHGLRMRRDVRRVTNLLHPPFGKKRLRRLSIDGLVRRSVQRIVRRRLRREPMPDWLRAGTALRDQVWKIVAHRLP